jgi:hypothetical protein
VSLDFPDDLEINGWLAPSGAYNSYGAGQGQNEVNTVGTLDPVTNSITWGDSARSTFGAFEGTVYFTVNVPLFEPELSAENPLIVGYAVYDDGYDGTVIDAEGTITIDELGYQFKTVFMWGLKNTTDNVVILEGQDKLYNDPSDQVTAPIVDGFQIVIGGSYEAPTDYSTITYTDLDGLESVVPKVDTAITSYGQHGWAASSRAIDTREQGTTDLTILIKDYEIRFTGEFEPETVGSQVLMKVKEGTGSMARLYASRDFDIADHPMNPNPGSSDPFMIRIPFEVWNVDDNQQINFDMYDRMQDFTTADTVYALNPNDRMYTEFINTAYKETLPTSEDLDQMTWNLVWWSIPYVKGEKLYVKYPNPILLGVDEFTFSTEGMTKTYNTAKTKVDVEKVNVFPNPYYAYNPAEPDRFSRYVTFNHLPPRATVRLFDLAGTQVRKLEKDDDTQFLRWDLRNESDIPVASGIYIVHIDMPDVGKTKILKVFIIQSQEMLKYY